ncbi:MAG: TRAP transporter substrate-binding protein, partial [Desulfobacterales bacterium]|nr:TRAP transporter substrate-binding protein [Desulfobacterales bacterium]
KLTAANYLPPTHKMSFLTKWFCDEVKNRTKGKVEITYHPGGTLLSPVKMYVGVTTGIADLGFSHTGYTRGRFPVSEALDLPQGYPSGYVAVHVSNDFYEKFKPAEWDDVHVLYLASSPPLVLHTNKKPVRTMEDLAGLKIRATGQMADVVKALGGAPVPIPMPDVYESLKRGVIDGVTVDLSPLKYWKFSEVIKYTTASWPLGTTYCFYFVINKNKWEKLSPDAQKVMTQVAMEARDKQALLWNEMDFEGRDLFLSKGGEMIRLSDAEIERWKKAAQPVIADYKASMVSKGYKEADVDSWLKFVSERISYWRAEEKKRGIPNPYLGE